MKGSARRSFWSSAAVLFGVLGAAGVGQSQDVVEILESLPEKRAARGDLAHRDGLEATQHQLLELVLSLGFSCEVHPVAWDTRPRREDKRTWFNIVFDIPGKTKPDEILIVGAHFDAVPNCPGADDNGTGTAAVVHMAHELRDVPMDRTVRFILFNLEEVGLIGSMRYARAEVPKLREAGKTIVGMMSLEMLGYYSDEEGSQTSPFKQLPSGPVPTVGDFLVVAGVERYRETFSSPLIEAMREADPEFRVLPLDFFPFPPPDLMRSDHASFWNMEVPAVMIGDTSNFRNPHYHQPTDTVETLDLDRYRAAVAMLTGAVRSMAGDVDGDAALDVGVDE